MMCEHAVLLFTAQIFEFY